MGLVGLFFNLALICFDVLAWPLFALGYPICASIQAIETNSISDIQKLITYWVSLSLVLMFEELLKLYQWLPFWYIIKLVLVGCLVTPKFYGSFYVYKQIIHPCLSMDLQVVINMLIKLKELFLKKYDLLVAFEPNFEEHKVAKKDIVEMAEKKETISTKKVRQKEPDSGLSGNRTSTPLETKEMIDATMAGRDFDILPSKKIEKEWTCAKCQVTTTSETEFILHLQGRQHENACEKLNCKNQTSNAEIPASVETSVLLESKEMGTATIAYRGIPDNQHSKGVQKMLMCSVCQETATSMTDLISHLQGKRHVVACGKLKAKKQTLKSNGSLASAATSAQPDSGCDLPDKSQSNSSQSPWTCAVCKVTASSKIDLISHFRGKWHAYALDKLKVKIETLGSNVFPATMENFAHPKNKDFTDSIRTDRLHSKSSQQPWTCGICGVTVTGEAALVSHLQGRRHVKACERSL